MKLYITENIENPRVIKRTPNPTQDTYIWEPAFINGKYYRIIPRNMDEINAVLMFDMHVDRFAPAEGHGVLISERAYQMLMV